jgi:transcriptional regulator of arginine metabolism
MNKSLRQRAILELLKHETVNSQEGLQSALRKKGIKVGQATLSRDIRELALSKTGGAYSIGSGEGSSGPKLPPVTRLVREFGLEVRTAQNLLVVKTSIGSAQPVAAALDDEQWPELVGTVAGDDTILIVCPDNKAAARLAERIKEMLG